MSRAMTAAILVGTMLFAAGALAADEAQKAEALIKEAIDAYDTMDYSGALPLLQQAEQLPGLTPLQRVNILKYRAFILILDAKEILARDAVTAIYELKPDFELPATVSPKFRRFFAEVRRDIAPRLQPVAPPERVITAKPVDQPPAPTPDEPPKVDTPGNRPNWFVRFWPSWTCFIVGAGLIVPGTLIGLDVQSGRAELENAPRDDAGHIVGITQADAQALQDDADKKGLTSMILLGAGAAAMVTGAVMFFVYDGAKEMTTRTSVSFATDGATRGVVTASWAF